MEAERGANADQITYWNEVSGPKWVALFDLIDAQISPLGREAMDRAQIRSGERVLDVGCGCGQTSVELAERVGSRGRVLGVDISAPMLAVARERAKLPQLGFARADAQIHAFEREAFDLVFSRFGVMFFEDPVAAFTNLRRALAPGGRLCFVCWQPLASNPWMRVPVQAIAQHVELPAPPAPGVPGPFSLADRGRVLEILGMAGFQGVACEPFEGKLALGRGLELAQIVDFVQQMGPAGALLREASDELRERAAASLHAALEPHFEGDAVVLDFSCWIVSAHAP